MLTTFTDYHSSFLELENKGFLRRPVIPKGCEHNAHMYYILLPKQVPRDKLILDLKEKNINIVFHYVPLHSSPAGSKVSRASGEMKNTAYLSQRIIRLPLWVGLTHGEQDYIVEELTQAIDRYF